MLISFYTIQYWLVHIPPVIKGGNEKKTFIDGIPIFLIQSSIYRICSSQPRLITRGYPLMPPLWGTTSSHAEAVEQREPVPQISATRRWSSPLGKHGKANGKPMEHDLSRNEGVTQVGYFNGEHAEKLWDFGCVRVSDIPTSSMIYQDGPRTLLQYTLKRWPQNCWSQIFGQELWSVFICTYNIR